MPVTNRELRSLGNRLSLRLNRGEFPDPYIALQHPEHLRLDSVDLDAARKEIEDFLKKHPTKVTAHDHFVVITLAEAYGFLDDLVDQWAFEHAAARISAVMRAQVSA